MKTPGQAQALRVNASHRNNPHVHADLFPRGQVWWECTCVRTTQCTKQPPSMGGHLKLCAYLATHCLHNLQEAPEIKAGRVSDSDLPTLRSQTPGYTARPLRPLASEQCSYRPARWSGWRWTCLRQAQTLGSIASSRLPSAMEGRTGRRKFSCLTAMVKPSQSVFESS